MADLLVIAAYLPALWLGRVPQPLNLDGELNVGAWWASGKLLLGAALVLLAGRSRAPEGPVRSAFYLAFSFGLLFLSLDENLGIHEQITAWTQRSGAGLPLIAGRHGAWIAVYGATAVVLALIFLKDILAMLRTDAVSSAMVGFGLSAVIAGGVVVEIMGYYAFFQNPLMQVAIEEALELFGWSLLLAGLYRHFLRHAF
ncbi:MAG: hypothetical protein HKN63_09310 [Rhodobacteraceae bacterium]|nr:hypothetical protein [Paracoccaceae bacterium]